MLSFEQFVQLMVIFWPADDDILADNDITGAYSNASRFKTPQLLAMFLYWSLLNSIDSLILVKLDACIIEVRKNSVSKHKFSSATE